MDDPTLEISKQNLSEMIDLLDKCETDGSLDENEDENSFFNRVFCEAENSHIEKRLPLNDRVLRELLLSLSESATDFSNIINHDDSLSFKNRFYSNVVIKPEFKHISESMLNTSAPLLFGTQLLVLMRSISNMSKDYRPEKKIPNNGMMEMGKLKHYLSETFDKICKDIQRKTMNEKDIELAKIALASIILLNSAGDDGLKQIYLTIKKYNDIDEFKPLLKSVFSEVFTSYVESINPELQSYALEEMSEILEYSDYTFSTLPYNYELEILETFNKTIFKSSLLAPMIMRSSSTISEKINEEFDTFIVNNLSDQIKSQKVRSAIDEIKRCLSTHHVSSLSSNNIFILMHAIHSIKSMIDENYSSELNGKIIHLKDNVKKQIDNDQLNGASETISIIKSLLSKSENTFINKISALTNEFKSIPVIDMPLEDNKQNNNKGDDELYHLLEAENEELELKLSKSREDTISLQRVNDELTQRLMDKGSDASLFRSLMFGNPTLTDVITGIKLFYPKVVWNDNITVQIKECIFSDPKKLFKILDIICGPYYQTIISGKPDSVAKLAFPCDGYSQSESKTVRNNKKLFNYRKFKVNGLLLQFSKHYTIGGDHNEKKCCQVYFEIDSNQRLMIGYIGPHLPL